MSGGRRVLLIGLDSADAELVENWVAEGFLPTFAKLRREGLWSRLGTTAEVMHVSAWPTLYTGTTPGQHGMYHAYQIRAGEQVIHRTEPARCGQSPFWKFLDDAGRRCIIFDAFMNYPGAGLQRHADPRVWHLDLVRRTGLDADRKARRDQAPLRQLIRRRNTAIFVNVPDDPVRFRDQLVAGTELKAKVTRALITEDEWDLLFVTFGEPHGAGHYLWHFGDREFPLHPQSGRLAELHAVRDVYAAVDKAIGSILEAVDDRTTVMIVSGDGMGPELFRLPPDAGDVAPDGPVLCRQCRRWRGRGSEGPEEGLACGAAPGRSPRAAAVGHALPAALDALQAQHEMGQFRRRLAPVEVVLHTEFQ